MAKQANPTVVGGFVVGALVLVVAGILIFAKGRLFTEEWRCVAFFDDSVDQLDPGAPVKYQGVQVGTVSGVKAQWAPDRETVRIPVELTFTAGAVEAPPEIAAQRQDKGAFMQHLIEDLGLKAELQQDSFVTGKLFVSLEFLPDEPMRRVGGTELQEIPTVQSDLSKLAKSVSELPLEELMNQALRTMEEAERLVGSPKIDQLLDSMDALVKRLDQQVVPLAESVETTLSDARGVLKSVDEQVQPLAQSLEQTLSEARATLASVNDAIGRDDKLVYRLAVVLDETAEAARAVRNLADYMERHPEALLSGKRK